jgi:hypothetical protein
MTKFGKLCARLYILRLYKMKENTKSHFTPGVILNYWHPLAWLLAIFMLVGMVIMYGVPEAVKALNEEPFRVSPWYAKNNKEIEWIKPDYDRKEIA